MDYERYMLPHLNIRGWIKLVCYLILFVLTLGSGSLAILSTAFPGNILVTLSAFLLCILGVIGILAFFKSGDDETIFKNGVDTVSLDR
jgi:hypothetical protein